MNPGALQPKKEALTEQVHAAFQQFEIYPVESRQGPQQLEIRTVRRGLAPPDTRRGSAPGSGACLAESQSLP